jgi:uncharacterized membrane protein YbaN (DUF454 family)
MHEQPLRRRSRTFLIVIGSIAVIIGVSGIVVPVLPTTPFLLLAAVCYGRSSQRLYNWLVTNRWCGRYIRNYNEGKGISRNVKILTLTLLWLTILFSVLCVVSSTAIRMLLIIIAIGVTVHILMLRTYENAESRTSECKK